MAFRDYIIYIPATIKAFSRFGKCTDRKRADDGKLSGWEFLECVGDLTEELFDIYSPIIRED